MPRYRPARRRSLFSTPRATLPCLILLQPPLPPLSFSGNACNRGRDRLTRWCPPHSPSQAATSEAALQEQASEHAAALSTKDEELAQQSRAAQHELRVLTREHEAALKAEVGKRHELEQTIATSDEATAHAHASLTSAKEELSVLRQRVEASEARATEKAELLAVAESVKAELQRKLTLAEEREQVQLAAALACPR